MLQQRDSEMDHRMRLVPPLEADTLPRHQRRMRCVSAHVRPDCLPRLHYCSALRRGGAAEDRLRRGAAGTGNSNRSSSKSCTACTALSAPVRQRPRIAAIVTAYFPQSHADVIVTKLIKGYTPDEGFVPPSVEIVSPFMDRTSSLPSTTYHWSKQLHCLHRRAQPRGYRAVHREKYGIPLTVPFVAPFMR